MDVVLMIVYTTLILGFLVLIHEGGHYLAARGFGVRVTEFMIGLPGPRIGFTRGDTTFGVTAVPLGGYARICGMGVGKESPHVKGALECVFRRGTANMEDVAADLGITDDDAYTALEELAEWGTIAGPSRRDKFNTYRTLPLRMAAARALSTASGEEADAKTEAQGSEKLAAPASEGEPCPLTAQEVEDFYEAERTQTYRALPFWKRCVIVLAGPAVNILFMLVAFVIVYSVVGYDVQDTTTGEISHIVVDPVTSIRAGLGYVGMVFMAIVGLFNPQTAAATVQDSTSLIGIAVLSKSAVEQGLISAIMFSAMLSVSLGLMNLLPIPPLDGGRFLVEIYQKLFRRDISVRAMNFVSMAGIALILVFFVFMVNQDVQRFVLGNWG